MADKKPMQASGAGTKRYEPDENGELASRRHSKGESDGGAYPNPHTCKKPGGFDGGQSGRAYHGTGRLGDRKTDEENENAPSST